MPIRPALVAMLALSLPAAAGAQQARDTRSVRQAYGARLDQKGVTKSNTLRWNNRIDSRIDSRIANRIERYTVNSDNAAAVYQQKSAGGQTNALTQSLPQSQPAQDDQQ